MYPLMALISEDLTEIRALGSELIAQGQRVEIVQRVLGRRDIPSALGHAELQDAQVPTALEGTAAP